LVDLITTFDMTHELLIPGQLGLAQLRRLCSSQALPVKLKGACRKGIRASAELVQTAADGGAAVYGVNTGFGKLANTRIAKTDLAISQLKLLRSHAVGVGEPLAENIVRLILLLKAASLARGHSGVREKVIDALLGLYNHGIYPVIPCQGSVGASGDLAPLAHLCLPLVGEGEVFYKGQRLPALDALNKTGLQPSALSAKEGLALINGTQVSTAMAIEALFATERVFEAAAYRALTHGSAIRKSHLEGDDRVQDPYCLRCQPQVMGACLDQMRHAARVLVIEANAVTDNPLVFAEDDALVSGGNFHAEPVALVCDALAVVIAEIGAIAERRIAMLVDTHVSGLPAFLTPDAGLNSGFMIVHVTAAALASEKKSMAHPASVDSLPTSANQEDHVSMATFAARFLQAMLHNTAHIAGIELLAAAQGIEFLRPLTSSAPLESLHALIRTASPAMMQDRSLSLEMTSFQRLVISGDISAALEAKLPELHALQLA